MSSRHPVAFLVLLAFTLFLVPTSGFAQRELRLIYPLMTHDTIQTTGIAVANPVDVDTDCEFWLVSNTGRVVDWVVREVAAGSQLALTLKEVFTDAPDTFEGYMLVFSESTNISIVGFFLSYTSDVTKIDGAEAIVFQGTASSDLIFPEVPSGAGAFTEISLVGFLDPDTKSPESATIKVLYEDNGVVKTAQQKVVTIPGGSDVNIGRYAAKLSDIFPGVTLPAKCYVRVTATTGIFGYEHFGNASSIAGRNAVAASQGNTMPVALFGAQLAEAAGYTSEITIINPTGLDAHVKIAAYQTGIHTTPVASKTVTIKGNGLLKEKTKVLFPNLPQGFIGWLRVDSDISGIVGDVTFGDEGPNKRFLSSVQLQTSPVTDYVFSQVAEGLGYVTGITFLNPNADPARVEVDVYDLNGNWTGSGAFDLEGHRHWPRVLSDIIEEPGFQQIQGYIVIRSDLPIFSFELFLYLPVFTEGVISLSAVPPQLGNGTISGKVTPGASSLGSLVSASILANPMKYRSSYAKGVRLDPQQEFIPGEVIVRLRPGAASGRIDEISDRLNARVNHRVDGGPHLLSSSQLSVPLSYSVADNSSPELAVAKSSTLDLVEALNRDPEVLYAEPNYLFHAHATPVDTHYHYQWHYPLMNLPAAWDETKGSVNTVVAVIDTGAKFVHSDLGGRLNGGQFDFISDQQRALDGNGIDADAEDPGDDPTGARSSYHGTHVAGTIGAATNNGNGVAGVNWNCKLMTLRALGLNGSGSLYDIAQAVLYAAGLQSVAAAGTTSRRAHVVNMSLGGASDSFTLRQAVADATARGVIIVASAGNDNVDTPSYPAWYDNVINVGAVDLAGEKAPYSNYGTKITVVAPGGNTAADLNNDGKSDGVLSTAWKQISETVGEEKYYFYQGTSMAAPHVAGVVSLMLAVNPNMTVAQAKSWLQTTAIDLGDQGIDATYGAGLVDAYKAVLRAKGTSSSAPKLAVTTATLDFGNQLTELSVTAFNAGTLPLNNLDFDYSPKSSWLSITPSYTSNGLALTVRVDRTGRPSGTYNGTIHFTSTNGGNVDVAVAMQVGGAGLTDIGDIYVLALDPMTLENKGQTTALFADEYVFQLPPTFVGSYVIVAGNDQDHDLMLGETGEYFSMYPVSSQPSLVSIYPNEDTPGIEFVLDNPQSQGATALLEEWKRRTGLAGIPVKPVVAVDLPTR